MKEELAWLEETPFFIGKDGLPSLGLFFGWFPLLIYKTIKKITVKRKIKKLERKGIMLK